MWIYRAPLIFSRRQTVEDYRGFCFSEACQPVTSVPATFRRGQPESLNALQFITHAIIWQESHSVT